MKNKILLLTLIIMSLKTQGQTIAGVTLPWQVAYNPNLFISASAVYESDTAFLDINNDALMDFRFVIHKSEPIIDGQHSIVMNVLNNNFRICDSTILFVHFYDYYDTILCTGSTSWKSDTLWKLGDLGGFIHPAPDSLTNKFIAYKDTISGIVGWMRITFDLTTPTKTFKIDSVLSDNFPTVVSNIGLSHNEVLFYPNPVFGDQIFIQTNAIMREVKMFDMTGKEIYDTLLESNKLSIPKLNGLFTIVARDDNDNKYIERIMISNK